MMESTSQVDLKTRLFTFGALIMSKPNSPRPEEIGIISGKESKVYIQLTFSSKYLIFLSFQPTMPW
jgi:hypothetical protein